MTTNNVFFVVLCFAFMGGVPFNAAQGSADLHPGTRAIQAFDDNYKKSPKHDTSLYFHNVVRTGKGSLDGHNFTGIDYNSQATADDRRIIYKALIRSTLYPKREKKKEQDEFLNGYLLNLFEVCIDEGPHFKDDYYHQLTTFVVSFLAITKDQTQRPEFYKFVKGFSNDVHQDTQFIDKIVASMPGEKSGKSNEQALEDFVKSIENSAAFKEAYGDVEGKKAGSVGVPKTKTRTEIQQRLDFLRRDLSELNDILLTHKDMKAKGTAAYEQSPRNFDDQIERNTAEKIKIEKEIITLEASLSSATIHAPASAYSAAAAADQPAKPAILLRRQPTPSSSDSSSSTMAIALKISLVF
ncbi:hypothetical protein [Candidatus Finniella inopinata]|uniref:Uncharacterized protein n=1 Tax=Candidatus Finniella inopinata TaxID=1696036 RepID=A0A4Q7DHI4_9PROT|nr:hypothetical protein [Candidatus Finniella inopinata]RZI46172.1 hypothetical protein EQU50_04350 [Candidatus Finniella inopinata]